MNNLDITLNKTDFEKNKEKYFNKWREDNPNEDEKEYGSYVLNPAFESIECEYDSDEIKVSGTLVDSDGEYIGSLSFYLEVDSDLASDIIEAQVKKYNKIKTILEATK